MAFAVGSEGIASPCISSPQRTRYRIPSDVICSRIIHECLQAVMALLYVLHGCSGFRPDVVSFGIKNCQLTGDQKKKKEGEKREEAQT